MQEAMPKAFYWLGTALLGNWVISACLGTVFAQVGDVHFPPTVDDSLFVASVNVLHRRYLYGRTLIPAL